MAWTGKALYGINVDPSIVGSRQVAQNPAGRAASAPIQVHRHARNSKAPDAWLINEFCEAANQGVLYRTKEVFSANGRLGAGAAALPNSTGADRVRWRWAFHTGVYARGLLVNMIMHPQDAGLTQNSATRVDIYSSATYGGSAVASATFNHGPNPGGSTVVNGLQYLKATPQYIEGLSADTDYYGIVTDVTYGRAVACSVAEMNSMTERFDGYMPQNITAESPILDVYRENLSEITYNLWRRGAATVLNFSTDDDPFVRNVTSATPKNLIDDSSTTYGAAIPGYTIDMTGKARRSQYATGVPVRFCAYVDVPAANTGVVTLRNSVGTAVITLTQAGAYTGWVVGTGLLPWGQDKYYITHHRSVGAGTVGTYAVSCYEFES